MPNGLLTYILTSTLPRGKFNFWTAQSVIWKSVHLYEYLIICSVKLYICIHPWNTTLLKIQNISMTLKDPSYPFAVSSLPVTLCHSAWGNHCSIFCHHKLVLSFLEFPINGIIHYILFCVFLVVVICKFFLAYNLVRLIMSSTF